MEYYSGIRNDIVELRLSVRIYGSGTVWNYMQNCVCVCVCVHILDGREESYGLWILK